MQNHFLHNLRRPLASIIFTLGIGVVNTGSAAVIQSNAFGFHCLIKCIALQQYGGWMRGKQTMT